MERLEGLGAGSHAWVHHPPDTASMMAESRQDGQPCPQGTPQFTSRKGGEEWPSDVSRLDTLRLTPYHWHTRNILWIQGRLPWIIPGRHA